ncbi:G-protein coupled receptor Mth-like 5 isoform X2 [Arctopsyche grandis]|uniref:G-protein coupled receptor Mth-like 5 isoform X2 n=1 Tax=Arctopsyche grandis TaxID=121162 RepID=UPI00406D83C0
MLSSWVGVAAGFVLGWGLSGAKGAPPPDGAPLSINKCCEIADVKLENRCTPAETLNTARWSPLFTDESGKGNVQIGTFQYVIGVPACETTQQWPIYHYHDSQDTLTLLPNGKLRHYTHRERFLESMEEQQVKVKIYGRLNEPLPKVKEENEPHFYDYDYGKYCMDKIINDKNETGLYALVCVPEINVNWSDTDFLMRKLVNPLFHVIGMICFLIVAIIYFILPMLRDLTGNIVTTINVCLILTQASDLVRIFTEFSSHVSFMIVDIVLYGSLLAAFFWLNSLGYYIWRTFKSRNVFLRVTDGRKYCYYMCYAWGCTILMCGLAIFAHFMLDTNNGKKKHGRHGSHSFITNGDQETIGWLGIAVFFTPIAFTIIINIFFYVTTLKVINRMNTYGRIHHKLKHNFDMFLLMFIVMAICWLFFILSWIPYNGLMYCHIFVNAVQGPLLLYICVLRQTHVTFLLRKSCCYNEPVPTSDWGDEMTQMNGSSY